MIRAARGKWRVIAMGLGLALAGASPLALAQAWGDIEGRIQYAYYTEDTRALNSLLAGLRPKPVDGDEASGGGEAGMRAYFRALAQYRLAQVQAAGRKSAARKAIDDCGDELDEALDTLPRLALGVDESPEAKHLRAEAYALGTACALAGREMSSMPFGGRIGSRIEEALKLEPRNPRVRLVEALADFDRAGKDVAAKAAAVEKLKQVTAMFEAARAAASTTPEWGAAEAYAFLGRALIATNDVVAAREALERALLIAPDYAFARRQMAQITR